MQVESIKVNMLGSFSVWVNGIEVVQNAAKLTKPWQLFCYLVLHRQRFTSNRKLISVLWADDMLTDPANVLKNAVYSLRKELCGGESFTDSPIVYSTGGYRFDPTVKLDLDVDNFAKLCEESKAETERQEEKMQLCKSALDAHFGDFLPQLDQELWVVPISLENRRKYLDCAHDLSEIYWQRKMHKELLELTTDATIVDQLDDKSNVYLFRALDSLRMYRVIVTTFSKVLQRYADALGGKPPQEVHRIYSAASERINETEQAIIVIKAELAGAEQEQRPQRGAYFCSYSNLKHIYPLLKRAAERNDQVLVLALFTLIAAKNAAPTNYDNTRSMAEFKVIALNNLRKSDAISRYSRNQYTMLLTVTSLADGRLVRDRIRDSFTNAAAGSKLNLDVKLTEI